MPRPNEPWTDDLRSSLPPLITVAQAAEYLHRSESSIRNYIASGALAATRPVGVRCVLVPRAALIRFLRGEAASA